MSFENGISIDAKARQGAGKGTAGRLRRDGFLPITVYGGDSPAASGTIAHREIAMVIRRHGRNTIFTLNLDGATSTVKIADMQLHPVNGRMIHLDLMRISLTEKSEFEVTLEIVGEAHGVKYSGGILDQPLHSLKVRCLPGDLPGELEIDVAALNVGDHIRVSDLQIDREKIDVLNDPEAVVVTVVAPRIEEEAPVEEAPAEPEVIKKGKTEDEE
jgi:large subunit ribosomal protein L25